MKKIIPTLLILVLFVPAFSVHAQTTDAHRQALLLQIQQLLNQIELLQQQLEAQQSQTFYSRILSNNAVIDTRYRLNDTNNFNWVTNPAHKSLMERFIELTPGTLDNYVEEFVFFTNEDDIDAFTETLDGYDSWRIGFSDYLLRKGAKNNLTTELLVHEIGHLAAYRKIQGEIPLDIFIDEIESNPYMFGYVSDYARTNDEEDFAESFMTFVFDDAYNGPGSEKVDFFYSFPTFVQYKNEIRSNI